jgi:2-polyprenyl-3-methyl-5-hydroxy-6-metoxy-1,4-benzoquinol methylase
MLLGACWRNPKQGMLTRNTLQQAYNYLNFIQLLSEEQITMGNEYQTKADFWDRNQKTIHSDYLVRPLVLKLLGKVKGKDVLDAGCGDGYLSRSIAKKGGNVVGIDISDKLIKVSKAKSPNIKFFVDSVVNYEKIFQNFDTVISVIVLQHLSKKDIIQSLQKTYSLLRSKGVFIIAIPHPLMFAKKPSSDWITFHYGNLSYWNTKKVTISLQDINGKSFSTKTYTHSLSFYLNEILRAGFQIKDVIETKPSKKDISEYHEKWKDEALFPSYMLLKLIKP